MQPTKKLLFNPYIRLCLCTKYPFKLEKTAVCITAQWKQDSISNTEKPLYENVQMTTTNANRQ